MGWSSSVLRLLASRGEDILHPTDENIGQRWTGPRQAGLHAGRLPCDLSVLLVSCLAEPLVASLCKLIINIPVGPRPANAKEWRSTRLIRGNAQYALWPFHAVINARAAQSIIRLATFLLPPLLPLLRRPLPGCCLLAARQASSRTFDVGRQN